MNNSKIQSILFKIISNELNINLLNLSVNKSINNYPEWDSLANLRLMLKIEDHFKIKIPFEETLSIEKIDDIYKLILLKLNKKN